MEIPKDLKPVLAKIGIHTSVGWSEWYEVIYFDDQAKRWRAYSGSDTFNDGERVLSWKYCYECL